jgi:hypothetical protein
LKHENTHLLSPTALPQWCLHRKREAHGTDPHWELSGGSCVEIHSQTQKSILVCKFKKVIWYYISADWDVAHISTYLFLLVGYLIIQNPLIFISNGWTQKILVKKITGPCVLEQRTG